MFSVKAPPILHSYPINYSRVWFLLSQSDALMQAVRGSSQPVSQPASQPTNQLWSCQSAADTMMPQPPALPLRPPRRVCCLWLVWLYPGRHSICTRLHCRSGDSCNLQQFLPVISICMRTRAIHSPLHKAQVLYLMPLITNLQVYSSTNLLVLAPKSGLDPAAEIGSLKGGRGFFFFISRAC